MSYFTQQDHASLALHSVTTTQGDSDRQLAYDKFVELHRTLHNRLRDHNYDLHPRNQPTAVLFDGSVSGQTSGEALVLTYLRSREQALAIERMMGRDRQAIKSDVQTSRHPVIELRLTPDHFSVELVVSPEAWVDQQNLIGKLGIQRHRETFRGLLQRMDGDFRLGFWSGCDLSDMHLTTRQLSRGNNLQEWMSTFCDGQDWLRVGIWYAPDAPQLDTTRILREMTDRIGALYRIYTFMLWSSNNDFLSFYGKPLHNAANARLA
jgi:hypothetical protein